MLYATVGRLEAEDIRLNKSGEDRWIRGEVLLHGPCQVMLNRDIHQRKLPFTLVTGEALPKEPVILLGEITEYQIPDSKILWKTLEVKKVIREQSKLFKSLDVTFDDACRRIARKDSAFLERLGSFELEMRKNLADLVGTKNKFVDRLVELFGDNAYDKLVENPWKVMHMVPYFGIEQADKVAEKLGIPLTDKRRFPEYFRYLLTQEFEKHRNTYMQENEFLAFYWMHFSSEMSLDEYKELTSKKDTPIIRTRLGYHPAHFYFAEKASYQIIKHSMKLSLPDMEDEMSATARVFSNSDITLTPEQEDAVCRAFHTPLHIITGGPGTGKTTVLNEVLQKLLLLTGADPMDEQAPFMLVAPTGKAAFRMWEQTGILAHTVNSAFGILPDYGCVDIEGTAKRLSHLRYLVIDEASMLDTNLFGEMCKVMLSMDHVPFLLLVGDADQLPPVSHGQVFKDLLSYLEQASPKQVTRLTVLQRQADGSNIPELASYIRRGTFPEQSWFDDKEDIFFVETTMDNFQNNLVDRVLLPKKEEINSIQILTPYRNGNTPDTIHAINRICEPIYNPDSQSDDAPEIALNNPSITFHIGDKVINRVNRSKEVINGLLGEIININTRPRDLFAWTITVCFENGITDTYVYEEFKQLEPAYAITIHASQGSEYENVVLGLLRGSVNNDFLNQNLLYVGVTRASKKLVLMGDYYAFKRASETKMRPRKTALQYWLSNDLKSD